MTVGHEGLNSEDEWWAALAKDVPEFNESSPDDVYFVPHCAARQQPRQIARGDVVLSKRRRTEVGGATPSHRTAKPFNDDGDSNSAANSEVDHQWNDHNSSGNCSGGVSSPLSSSVSSPALFPPPHVVPPLSSPVSSSHSRKSGLRCYPVSMGTIPMKGIARQFSPHTFPVGIIEVHHMQSIYTSKCGFCNAFYSPDECTVSQGKYNGCCNSGKVKFSFLNSSKMQLILDLLDFNTAAVRRDLSRMFHQNIRQVNNSLSFTSTCMKQHMIPEQHKKGPPILMLEGVLCHKISDVLQDGSKEHARYMQAYFLQPSSSSPARRERGG